MPRDDAHEYVAYAFATTHDVLAAEAVLEDVGVPSVVIPTPEALGAHCGVALRLEPGDTVRAERVLEAAGLGWTGRTAVQDV